MLVVVELKWGVNVILDSFNKGWFFGRGFGFVMLSVVVFILLFCSVLVRLVWLIIFLCEILISVVVGFIKDNFFVVIMFVVFDVRGMYSIIKFDWCKRLFKVL